MKHPDRLSSIFFILFATVICFTALKLPWGTLKSPGPMLFPMLLGLSLLVLAILLLLQSVPPSRFSFGALFPKEEVLKIFYFLIIFFGSIFLLEPLGFLISTFTLLTLLFKIIGDKKVIRSILYGLTISLVTYWSFSHLLGVRLPRGVLLWF